MPLKKAATHIGHTECLLTLRAQMYRKLHVLLAGLTLGSEIMRDSLDSKHLQSQETNLK